MELNEDYVFYSLTVGDIQKYAEDMYGQRLNDSQMENAMEQICAGLDAVKSDVVSSILTKERKMQ